MLEKYFEKFLVNSRFITILPVIFGLLGAFMLFFIASFDVYKVIKVTYTYYFLGADIDIHEEAVSTIVGAVDLYLMALVFYIFSFGIYELFISDVEEFKQYKQSKVLEVHSLDELKDKLGKVIIMVLVVNFFQHALNLKFSSSMDMLYLAIGIMCICLGLWALHKSDNKSKEH
ncbi:MULTISPECIES: YqhA family protein [unclassified Campylobacter]|uniref:YqhA family protein n=1 Tax=unclassified Campylobacter TaxID=2593542 RepID=UPI001BDAAB36|nr:MULTISPECIES: YqhA family protein [unclassified Campylobacter]MBZ7976661.1 YqhA family protein [Campylobacter sp. RM12637]MBZ7978315.1 YqhA family protein [Campylobacter sp. RM12654]MBZ7979317.1 YqhA family protein [Campylobacter sp. RM12642]MBZ7984025.1 YqhA family protein [Campylobacter sp. RM12647]MBZ7991309.1 YqhA family protein [Campylobacter sp. RM9331]MBZ7993054.1 YqhA family protein [Campylobacter sp. RM9333]MBZ8005907.1 YqhA family protein [Campylobacter sp. RM9332]MBZ8007844.1 